MPFLSPALQFNKQFTAARALCASYAMAQGLLYNECSGESTLRLMIAK